MSQQVKNWATAGICLLVWFTIVAIRTKTLNDFSLERGFAILGTFVSLTILGMNIQKILIRHDKDKL